jgi:prepilin peptidase CpaA
MFGQLVFNAALLIPLTALITYYDVRYRRIPNTIVLVTLISGLVGNTAINGWHGALDSFAGSLLALGLMLILHLFGALGAGDVKLFAGIGAALGMHLVLPTFCVVVILGGILAVFSTLLSRTAIETAHRVSFIFLSLLVDWRVPRFAMPADQKQTIPYGVAISFGSLVSLAIFRA